MSLGIEPKTLLRIRNPPFRFTLATNPMIPYFGMFFDEDLVLV